MVLILPPHDKANAFEVSLVLRKPLKNKIEFLLNANKNKEQSNSGFSTHLSIIIMHLFKVANKNTLVLDENDCLKTCVGFCK